jgi:peptidoglycan/LPS O-acetylase OafA/YrhL
MAGAGAAPFLVRRRLVRPGAAITQLTSLRYFAAFAVMLSHLDFLDASSIPGIRWLYNRLFHEGYCGVSFFFVLSGFIITHAYRDELLSGRMSTAGYLARRAARIFPMHWLVALPFMAWLVIAEDRTLDPVAVGLNLLLLHGWAMPGALHFSFNGPSWSLSDELFFYAMFPLLILLRPRILGIGTGVGILVVTALAIWSAAAHPRYSNDIEWFFYVNPLVRLTEFAAGILVYETYRAGRFRRRAGTPAEIALLVAVPVMMMTFSILEVPMPLRYQIAYLPLMMALVFVFACGRGRVSRGLCAPCLVLLGQASFSLYLIHRPIFTLVHGLSERYLGEIAAIPVAAALLAGCSAASILVYRHIEAPVQRVLQRRLRSTFPPKRLATRRLAAPGRPHP